MGMLGELVFNKTTLPVLIKSLDASMLRSRVISNNVANVTTPGFQRLEVKFEDELRTALDRTRLRGRTTDKKHMAIGRKNIGDIDAQVERPVDPTLASGVNNVDIDMEMAKLAENQIMFNYAVKFAQGAYRKINSAIQAKPIPPQ